MDQNHKYKFLKINGTNYFLTNRPLNEYNQKYWFKDLEFVRVCHVNKKEFNILQKYAELYPDIYSVKFPKTDLPQKVIGGVIIKELDIIKDLPKFISHRRLKVFNYKGLECSNPKCKKKGHYFLMTTQNGGIHLDIYTKNLELMTVDHIIPKSKGGPMTLDNLRPMCRTCNSRRGNDINYFY